MNLSRLIAVLSVSFSAIAGESADYVLKPRSPSAGGRSHSAAYTLDASLTPGGTMTSQAHLLRGGFSGSLADAAALDITASPPVLNEGGASQMSASLVMDDATLLLLPSGDVMWNVISGPATVNASGLVSAAMVNADTSASVRGIWRTWEDSLALTILNVPPYDYSSDSLPDDWQMQYFGAGNPNAAPGEDPDGDGWNNLFEYTAGLVPVDPASRFLIAVATVPGQPANKNIIFSPVLPGSIYTVQTTASLAAGPWQGLTNSITSDAGNVRTVTDLNGGTAQKFYRVEVRRP